MLEYCGAEWTEKFYQVEPKEDDGKGEWSSKWDLSDWRDVKESDQMQEDYHFPNLPWMKDGEIHLTQSTTILKVS